MVEDMLLTTSGWHNSAGSSAQAYFEPSLPAPLNSDELRNCFDLDQPLEPGSPAATSTRHIQPQAFMNGDTGTPAGQAEAELEALRRRVDRTLSSTACHSHMGPKFGDLVQRARALRSELDAAAAQNQQLHSNFRFATIQVELGTREQLWMQLDAGHRQAPLAKHAALLGAPQGARPASCGAQVSVLQLPAPDAWDRAWCSRVRGLQTLDVLLLHRQFLQRCSLLLPRAEKPGGYAPVRQELDQLCSRYQTYSQQLMRLAPGPWDDSFNFSLETLQPLQEPLTSQALMRRGVIDFWSPGERRVLAEVQARFGRVLAQLRQRQAALQQHLHSLCGGGASGSGAAGFESEPDSVQATVATRLLEANLQQQKFQHRSFINTINTAIPAISIIQTRLSVYPGALNGHLTGLPEYL